MNMPLRIKKLNFIFLFAISALAMICIFSLAHSAFANDIISILDQPPAPELRFPNNDIVNLRNKEYLEFKWSRSYIPGWDYYDFRIYKGYSMTAATLIYKEQVSCENDSISLDASKFNNGQVYTWSLALIVRGRFKGERSYNSFKVIKD